MAVISSRSVALSEFKKVSMIRFVAFVLVFSWVSASFAVLAVFVVVAAVIVFGIFSTCLFFLLPG